MPESVKIVEPNSEVEVPWCTIFNTYRYFNHHRNETSRYFCLVDASNEQIIGVCHITEVEPGTHRSPGRGTFGGFELRYSDIESLIFFVAEVEKMIAPTSRRLVLSTAPFHHNPAFSSQLFSTLFNRGYKIDNQDLNHSINVDQVEMIEKMNRNNKKRLRKCIRDGFVFEQVTDPAGFETVYEIIATNRKSKGYEISMTFSQLMEMVSLFPESVYFFKASLAESGVASGICIRLNKNVLYVFYWGEVPGYEQHSPVAFIADGIYKFAQQNGFTILDVGASTIKGEPNLGVFTFKQNLGFDESLKITYSKQLQ